MFIFEIRDARDITVFLSARSEIVERYQSTMSNILWTPSLTGKYRVHVYAISDLIQPDVLTSTSSLDIEVVASSIKPISSVDISDNDSSDSQALSDTDKLKQYALQLINKDRKEFGLAPVRLSNNIAAQKHADDLYKTGFHSSHWTSDGMKPYMRYTMYDGKGAVAQNVHAGFIYSPESIKLCESGFSICTILDMHKQLEDSEYVMMYDDEECCHNGHRDNILDKHHTSVSIGIAYDKYYFAYVQNFENNNIDFNKPITENKGYASIAGTISNGSLYTIAVYYDEVPTPEIYQRDRDLNSYSYGELAGLIVKPPPPGYRYQKPSNYSIIESDERNVNGESFEIAFNLYELMRDHGPGEYTISMILGEDDQV